MGKKFGKKDMGQAYSEGFCDGFDAGRVAASTQEAREVHLPVLDAAISLLEAGLPGPAHALLSDQRRRAQLVADGADDEDDADDEGAAEALAAAAIEAARASASAASAACGEGGKDGVYGQDVHDEDDDVADEDAIYILVSPHGLIPMRAQSGATELTLRRA